MSIESSDSQSYLTALTAEGSKQVWVYDTRVIHSDQTMVYLFSTKSQKTKEYSRDVRSRLAQIPVSESKKYFDQYTKWYDSHGEEFVARETENVEKRKVAKYERISAHHQEYLRMNNQRSAELVVSSAKNRFTNCYKCKKRLESSSDYQCAACGWLVCSTDGACGCGWVGH